MFAKGVRYTFKVDVDVDVDIDVAVDVDVDDDVDVDGDGDVDVDSQVFFGFLFGFGEISKNKSFGCKLDFQSNKQFLLRVGPAAPNVPHFSNWKEYL